jgi:hypothetical protein
MLMTIKWITWASDSARRRMGEWRYSFTPRKLYPQEKSPRYPLDRRPGGPQSRFGRCGKENKSSCRESNPGYPAHSVVAILTELTRQNHKESVWKTCLQRNAVNISVAYIQTVKWRTSVDLLRLGCPCSDVRGCIRKFPDWPPGVRNANGTAACH